MPEPIRQMTEANERLASLETNMGYVLGVLAKREEYQASVLKSLTTIEIKQDQSLLYQKTCDAERTAHASRIGSVENAVTAMSETLKKIEDHARRIAAIESSVAPVYAAVESLDKVSSRLAAVEKHITRGSTVWWVIVKIAAVTGGLAGFAATVVGLWRHP